MRAVSTLARACLLLASAACLQVAAAELESTAAAPTDPAGPGATASSAEGSSPTPAAPGAEASLSGLPPRAWTVVPSLSASEHFTDNLFLAAERPQSGFYTTWVPGLAIRGDTRRLQVDADWAAERLMFLDDPELDRTTQRLHGHLAATLIEEHLFVDAFGALYPSLVEGAGRLGNLGRNARSARGALVGGEANRTDVTTWGVTPRWRQDFGSFATFTASATFSDTATDAAGRVGGGEGRDWRARLETGRRFQRWHWGLDYERRDNEASRSGVSSVFQRLWLDSRWDATRKLALTAALGVEDNQFVSRFRQRHGPVWQLGFDYTPTPRSSVRASVGERSFGSTKAFALRHRLRSFVLSARYDEDLRTTSELLRARAVLPATDAFGQPLPVDPAANLDGVLPLDQLSLVDEVFVNRVFSAGLGYQRRRDEISLNVYRVLQGATRRQREEVAVGTTAVWRHQFGRRLSGGLQLNYQSREAGSPRLTTDFAWVSPFLQWQLGPSARLVLNYSWMESASSRATDSFRENALMLGLSYAF